MIFLSLIKKLLKKQKKVSRKRKKITLGKNQENQQFI